MENTIRITDLTFDEIGLIHYVPNTTRLRVYIGWMKQCRTIKQLMDRVAIKREICHKRYRRQERFL